MVLNDMSEVSFIHPPKDLFRATPCAFVMNFEAFNSLSNASQGKRVANMKQEDPEMIELPSMVYTYMPFLESWGYEQFLIVKKIVFV